MIIMDINTCFETTKDYRTIAFYSHLIPVFITVIVSAFVLIKSKFSLASKTFCLFAAFFCLWLLGDVITWTSSNYNLIAFIWSPLDYINIIFFLLGAYFLIVIANEKDISWLAKVAFFIISLPSWWITITNQSISVLNQPVCEALNNEFQTQYKLWVEILVIAFIMFYAFFKGRKSEKRKRTQIVIVSFALVLFFSIFSVTEYISSQTGIYEINLYSLFILPLFLLIIIYSITNLEIFKVRLIGSQLLAYLLIIMVGSQFFFLQNTTDRALTVTTFIVSLGFGILLIRSGRREAEAREKVEKLATELETAYVKLKELDHQKDAVLHMVAHQLKGPVTTINYTTELLLDGTYGRLNAEQKENVTTIRKASQKMGSQSEMVLDAAKITSGKFSLNPEPLDLNALLKEIVDEAKNHAKERNIHLKLSLPNLKLPTVILDKKYTQLAIDNLLSNAVKYTALKSEGGNVEFTVEIKNKTLYCIVKDTGIGIPQKDQEHIFKELYRASNAGKEGNGLGLHVAMGAIEAQGGKIHYESTENVGTTFYLELPLKEVPAEEGSDKK